MNKRYRPFLAMFLAAVTLVTAVGCSDGNKKDSLVALNYGTGLAENGEYNVELYGMNGMNDVNGADPGVIYVSEDEDPIYGGYYYMYVTGYATGDGGVTLIDSKYDGIGNLAFRCWRSKDLYNWELSGYYENGWSVTIDEDDWCNDMFWAPEVIRNPADGKYYMYFSAAAKKNLGVTGVSADDYGYDRLYLSVAVSDSPIGPFDVICDVDAETGKKIPTINFQVAYELDNAWAAIDASPFFDDDGSLYLYMRKHPDSTNMSDDGIWGMKMKSMEYPDYDTLTCLTIAGKITASGMPGSVTETSGSGEYYINEGAINEAPFMIKHDGKYYLTYSAYGYTQSAYSVHQAISDDPLSGFEKVDAANGNAVLDGNSVGTMSGTGHHAFVKNGEELWILYHRHYSKNGWSASAGRCIAVDRVNFVKNSEGLDVLTANGPSMALQWLPENRSGYKNLAETAEVKISSGSGVQYLTDRVMPYYLVSSDMVMKTDEDVTITLKWSEPVSVSSVMIYNANDVSEAFSKISDIRFKLSGQPEWANKAYDYAVIKDCAVPSAYWDADSEEYTPCGPVVAEFDALTITELQITIKAEDRLVEYDRSGEKNTALKISEIVVLGKE